MEIILSKAYKKYSWKIYFLIEFYLKKKKKLFIWKKNMKNFIWKKYEKLWKNMKKKIWKNFFGDQKDQKDRKKNSSKNFSFDTLL